MECSQQITIVNKLGLHARAAAKLVALASNYQSKIQLVRHNNLQEQTADCKSIISVMMLAAGKGTRLELQTQGEDAQQAKEAICALISNGFDELD